MIYLLTGTVALIREEFIVVDVHGVGYCVYVSALLKNTLSISQPIQLFTLSHYREDAQELYGFLTEDDRRLFNLLTSVSGVGPKLGLKIVSEYATEALIKILLSGDLARLTAVSGVGKKVGERLILELKDKIPKLLPTSFLNGIDLPVAATALDSALTDDLRMALSALGYHSEEIKRALKKAAPDLGDSPELEKSLKVVLKYI